MRIALFGAGRIGQLHAKHVAEHPDLTLAYVIDRVEAHAAAVAARTGAALADAEQVFTDPAVDGVVIASPTDTHVDLVQRAASAGKAIFCEKPLSLDYATAEACVQTLNRRQSRCMLGFHRRYDPKFRSVRDRIRSGEAGTVHQIVLTSRTGATPPLDYVRASGGLFRDSAIHDLDMARYLLGEEMASVYAAGGCLADPAIGEAGDIDTALITMVSRTGTLVQITNGRHSPCGYDQRVEVLTSRELLRVENETQNGTDSRARGGLRAAPSAKSFLDRYAVAYRAEMDGFADMVRKGTAPLADQNDGLEAQRLAEAAARSFREGRPVMP